MTEPDAPTKKWFSVTEAAQYLDVAEPTLYRWMRDNKITFRKVGESTRFWQEDLDAVMQVFRSERDLDKVRQACPLCHHTELVEGRVRGAGLLYFVPSKTRFWTLKDSFVGTSARVCTRCGAVTWFADLEKLEALRIKPATAEPQETAPTSPPAKAS